MSSSLGRILVFGATGTAGSGVVQACLAHPEVGEVRAVTRRPLGLTHAKLTEVHCTDFANLAPISGSLQGVDICLYCLGISARKVSGEDEYRTIHVTYPLAAARALREQSPTAAFIYLSGAGAKSSSSMMWARVKAEAEEALGQLGLERYLSVRPSMLVSPDPTGPSRWLLAPLVDAIPAVGIRTHDLGRAMLRAAADPSTVPNGAVLENRELRRLVAR